MYRKTRAQIFLPRLRDNIRNAIAALPKGCELIAVVKSDAYGHGALAVAQTALRSGATMLAVALAEEGLELREGGVDAPILILGRSNPRQLELAVALDLMPCVFEAQDVYLLQEIAQRQAKTVQVQLKIDTGMSRIGLMCAEEMDALLDALHASSAVRAAGVFTHFANSDEQDMDATHQQAQRFETLIARLRAAGHAPKVHASNSAAVYRFPQYCFDAVRWGIAMYGYAPSAYADMSKIPLAPVMEVLAEVAQVKWIEAGTAVGYGGTQIVKRPTKLATVQIGYGDGYNRLLSGRGSMIVEGEAGAFLAPVVGRVCMDMTMIDVTDVPVELVAGDVVVAMGQRQGVAFTAEDMARICDTIPYEIVLDYTQRVPREMME